jgi:hypothetical protein
MLAFGEGSLTRQLSVADEFGIGKVHHRDHQSASQRG